jgi:hypothetical protein
VLIGVEFKYVVHRDECTWYGVACTLYCIIPDNMNTRQPIQSRGSHAKQRHELNKINQRALSLAIGDLSRRYETGSVQTQEPIASYNSPVTHIHHPCQSQKGPMFVNRWVTGTHQATHTCFNLAIKCTIQSIHNSIV